MTTSIADAVVDMGIKTKSVANFPSHIKTAIEKVKIADLEISHEDYQRLINTAHAKRIHREFDETYFMVPLIFRRKYEKNKMVIVDGQQRLTAAHAGGSEYADCIVIDSTSPEDEARAFLKINTGRKAIPPATTLKAKNTTGDETAEKFIEAVEIAGFESHEKAGHLRLKGVTGVLKSTKSYGLDNLTNALLAYKLIWPDHSEVNADVVRGLMFLINTYRKKGEPQKVSAAMLGRMLNSNIEYDWIPKEVNATMGGGVKFNHQDRDYRVALVIIKAYNKTAKGRACLTVDHAKQAWMNMAK